MSDFLGIFKRIALQFLLLLGCFFLSRVMFTLMQYHYFEGITLSKFLLIAFAGLRYDISAIFAINSLYFLALLFPYPKQKPILMQKALNVFFIVSNTLAFLFEISDWAYFPFNQKRSTADVLDMITRKGDFTNQLFSLLIQYWYIPVSCALFTFLFVYTNKAIINATPGTNATASLFKRMTSFFLVIFMGIIGIRGGLQYVPIGIRNAVEATENQFVPIVLNTPFSILTTLNNNKLEEEKYFDDETLKRYINTDKQYQHSTFEAKNVVILILESYSKEFTGLGGMKSYTPFLDSLMQHSLVCTNAFANGYRSAEGIPAILSGIPSIQQEPFTTSPYGTNRITTIVNLLSQKGYSSAFYHGGTNGTMSFDLFAKNAGFQRYAGRKEYANDNEYDGVWGIWDEPFLQYCNKDISTNLKEPFVTSIFTISSHPPYKVPTIYQSALPKGTLPIHQPIAYTDLALEKFFNSASRQKWYRNTLFVIVADHCSPLSENDYYHYHQGRFAIPIVYFSPNDTNLKGSFNELTQQIDILPSVMDYLGYNEHFFAFGNSIFSEAQNRYTIQQWSGNQLWTLNNYFLRCAYQKPDGLFDTQNDKLCSNNLLKDNDSIRRFTLNHLLAFRQAYSEAMIHNKLWIK